MITSTQNSKVRHARALNTHARNRAASSSFVIEGIRLMEEAYSSGVQPHQVFYTQDINQRGRDIVQGYTQAGIETNMVSPHVMASISDTQSQQGLLAVYPMIHLNIPEQSTWLVILDELRDPGNMGSIFRTAAIGGVDAVFLSPKCVDPYSPKVLRAAMGAHFHLPIKEMTWEEITTRIRPDNQAIRMNICLLDAHAGTQYTAMDFRQPSTMIIGGEAHGASRNASALANERVSIPMPGSGESLNAAVAFAIAVYEVIRQRSRIE